MHSFLLLALGGLGLRQGFRGVAQLVPIDMASKVHDSNKAEKESKRSKEQSIFLLDQDKEHGAVENCQNSRKQTASNDLTKNCFSITGDK